MNAQVVEASELHIQLDQLKEKLQMAEEEKTHLKGYYSHRLEQQQCELDNYLWVMLADTPVNNDPVINGRHASPRL